MSESRRIHMLIGCSASGTVSFQVSFMVRSDLNSKLQSYFHILLGFPSLRVPINLSYSNRLTYHETVCCHLLLQKLEMLEQALVPSL